MRAKLWRAPGVDGLPLGFLKACGQPFRTAILALTRASLALSYFPQVFQEAAVIFLRKPKKTIAQLRKVGGWRPISFFSATGKILKTVIARRLAKAAEEYFLLPEEQFGCRPGRFTELVIRLVTDLVYTAWKLHSTASLLQLDSEGAFDRVDHRWLLYTLDQLGLPTWLIEWVRSYLGKRTARLRFDGETSSLITPTQGIPQGSPLSPILFILFLTPLYTKLREEPGISIIGFSDDTNLLAYGKTTDEYALRLRQAYRTAEEWAAVRGMVFEPSKSELI